MQTVLFSIAIVALSMTGLALGVLLGRPPLSGSCGAFACRRELDCAGCRHRREDAGR